MLHKRRFDDRKTTRDPSVVGGLGNWDDYPCYGKITMKGWPVDAKPRLERSHLKNGVTRSPTPTAQPQTIFTILSVAFELLLNSVAISTNTRATKD